MKYFIFVILFFTAIHSSTNAQVAEPLGEDETGIIESLPINYPKNWIFTNSPGFPSGGSIAVIDVSAENNHKKGAIFAGFSSDVTANNTLGEIYVLETYYSRGNRGPREDLITIYDQSTLKTKGEIILETGKRFLVGPMMGKFRLFNDNKWALVANYTPASSITIVDIENRKILNEISVPGCMLAYPLGKRGFATLCGYGDLLSVTLDENGEQISEYQSEVFNDLDNDPYFVKHARVGDMVYLPSFKGMLVGLDLSGDQAKIGEAWSLVSDEERQADWRPSGWQLITADANGLLYIIMQENGFNGSHKDGGTEVWVFDPISQKRVNRIILENAAYTIVATMEDSPHIIVGAKREGMVDVYQATGEFIRSIKISNKDNMPIMYATE